MSGYRFRPESIVNQISRNLGDRYDSGYPILKELLQNADDAGAHRFRLDGRAGWRDAENPLPRGPGLLIVNDGARTPRAERRRRRRDEDRTPSGVDRRRASGARSGPAVHRVQGHPGPRRERPAPAVRLRVGDVHQRRRSARRPGGGLGIRRRRHRVPRACGRRVQRGEGPLSGLHRGGRRGDRPPGVLGVGHTLFDVALDEARDLPVRMAVLDGLDAPLLVVEVEDEVTGTGSLVRRLIFGVTEANGRSAPVRDWALLQRLNGVSLKDAPGVPARMTTDECAAVVERLRNAFQTGLSELAPTFLRPVCWPEMLFVPAGSDSSPRPDVRESAATGAG